jgi:hypothetical protein
LVGALFYTSKKVYYYEEYLCAGAEVVVSRTAT